MTKIILHGCNGHMGQTVVNIVNEKEGCEIVAGIDTRGEARNGFPVFSDINECNAEADVIVDFSSAAAIDGLLDYCEARKIPVVLCTTGLSENQLERVKEVSESVAVLKSTNMSLGINMLLKLLKSAVNTLEPAGFDMEIVEKHHNKKVDAPSGTAMALGEVLRESAGDDYYFVYDRSNERKPRDRKEIGLSAVRGGNIVGEHEVIFAGEDEVITFKHTAYSKAVFAKGAVEAAAFLAGKAAGLYDMQDVIADRI